MTAVGLLVTGLSAGIYLGQDREVQQNAEARLVVQVAGDDELLLEQRQAEQAAARARQRAAENNAAEKAATEAKAAADKAHKLEKKAIERKAAEAKAKAEAAAEAEAEEAQENEESDDEGDDRGSPDGYNGPIPSSCKNFDDNRGIGCALMLDAGFKISQWPCLDNLWRRESGWDHEALNPSSKAYGIPQALPGRKMRSAGSDWRTNPATQIEWGLGYIKGRYGTPCKAWNHSEDVGWY